MKALYLFLVCYYRGGKKMKKIVLLLSVTVLMLLILTVGCSNGTPQTSNPEENVKLELMSWWAYVDQELIDQFEADNPGIEVDWEYVEPGDPYANKIRTLSSSDDLPDVYGVQGPDLAELVKNDFVMDLTEPLASKSYDQDESWEETMNPILMNNVKDQLKSSYDKDEELEGKNYGIPFGAISVAVVYNKKIFDEVGIDEPQNWDEFMSNNQKLKESGYIPMSFVGQIWGDWWLRLVWDQTIRDVTTEDFESGKVKFTDDGVKEAFKVVKDMWDQEFFNPAGLTAEPDQTQQLFVTGKLAQYYVVPENFVKYLVENKPEEVELGGYVLPGAKGVEPVRTLGGAPNILSVNNNTKHKEAAIKLAKFLTSQTAFQMLADDNVVPSLRGYQPPEGDHIMGAFAKAAEGGFMTPHVPYNVNPEFREFAIKQVYPKILLGELSIDEAAEQLQQEYENIE